MKTILLVLISSFSSIGFAQNKNTIFYDSVGQRTSFEGHWAQVVTGKYKSVYNKSENSKTLIRATSDEFQAELDKTDKRIRRTNKLGTEFPEFDVEDMKGNRLRKQDLLGKVVVLNFWFIGCAPCEMERPALNELVTHYTDNTDVIFIAFAKNDKSQLDTFLEVHPVLYKVVPTGKDYIKSTFEINAYPVNIILGKDGRYFYNSGGSGIGITTILRNEIDKALRP